MINAPRHRAQGAGQAFALRPEFLRPARIVGHNLQPLRHQDPADEYTAFRSPRPAVGTTRHFVAPFCSAGILPGSWSAGSLLVLSPIEGPAPRWVRETEAEAVAYVVCEAVGVKSPSSADYVHLSGGDAATWADSLDRVQRASAEILAVILPGD